MQTKNEQAEPLSQLERILWWETFLTHLVVTIRNLENSGVQNVYESFSVELRTILDKISI